MTPTQGALAVWLRLLAQGPAAAAISDVKVEEKISRLQTFAIVGGIGSASQATLLTVREINTDGNGTRGVPIVGSGLARGETRSKLRLPVMVDADVGSLLQANVHCVTPANGACPSSP